jgi:hypothetical protein
MDRPDHLPAFPDGLACTVCEAPVPAGRIRLLARRGGLAFVQSDCAACGSTTLAFLLSGDRTGPGHPAAHPIDRPVSADDVAAMRDFLAAYEGDLATLVGPGRSGGGA